jgi:hypothetical protein
LLDGLISIANWLANNIVTLGLLYGWTLLAAVLFYGGEHIARTFFARPRAPDASGNPPSR